MHIENGHKNETLSHFDRDYRPALVAFFLRRIGSRSEAEDLTQEVFIRIAQGNGREIERAGAYIFQIAANLLRDRARRQKIRQDYAVDVQASWSDIDVLDPHRIAVARESLSAINGTLAQLPERTRQIFLLFRYEQIDRRSIAASFGISVSAVEKHIYRAMAKLIAATDCRP